ncbi:MAG: phenylacetate-CoA oxygenase/reductase subunit PaaK [Proteobacteria bacterium]|nr:phenylacetate-CoA oxygenase/reductase subunit PaaK [Pseudomonadota bacterium]
MSVGFHQLKIADVRRETSDAVSILFQIPEELKGKFQFRPGQHLTLKVDINGEEVRRNYSVCVAPHENELRIAVKEVPQGRFSSWANREIKAGHVIDAMPPHGSFTWTFEKGKKRRYLLMSGGSGITPILSLLKTGLREEPDSEFVLFYGNRASHTIMFLEELANLKDRYMSQFELYHFLDEEEGEVDLFNGRLDLAKTTEALNLLVGDRAIDAVFICGPGPMMTAAEEAAKKHGIPPEKILIERFTADGLPAPVRDPSVAALEKKAQGSKVQVRIDGRLRTLAYDADKGSILENARAAGLPAPFACKAGVCATCKAKVIEGEVQMKTNYGLAPEDIAQGFVLTCQAFPVSDKVVLDYDV